MITAMFSIVLFTIFTLLGCIHFYWAFGGKWGVEKVIPTKSNNKITFTPPKIATFIVGLVLVFFGIIYFTKLGIVNIKIPNLVIKYGCWIIPSIFILRAIGDFNYVGFFKKIKNTEFSKADSKWFIPLCLIIGILGIVFQLINR